MYRRQSSQALPAAAAVKDFAPGRLFSRRNSSTLDDSTKSFTEQMSHFSRRFSIDDSAKKSGLISWRNTNTSNLEYSTKSVAERPSSFLSSLQSSWRLQDELSDVDFPEESRWPSSCKPVNESSRVLFSRRVTTGSMFRKSLDGSDTTASTASMVSAEDLLSEEHHQVVQPKQEVKGKDSPRGSAASSLSCVVFPHEEDDSEFGFE